MWGGGHAPSESCFPVNERRYTTGFCYYKVFHAQSRDILNLDILEKGELERVERWIRGAEGKEGYGKDELIDFYGVLPGHGIYHLYHQPRLREALPVPAV